MKSSDRRWRIHTMKRINFWNNTTNNISKRHQTSTGIITMELEFLSLQV
jgi:hypothetical protein